MNDVNLITTWRRPIVKSAILLVLTFSSLGCERGAGRPGSEGLGELTVRGDTVCAASCRLQFTKVATYGSEHDRELIRRLPRVVQTDSAYLISFVPGAEDHPIIRHDSQGAHPVGRYGSGPGEYRRVQSIIVARDSLFVLHDGNRITVYDKWGEPARSLQTNIVFDGGSAANTAGSLFVPGQTPQPLSKTRVHQLSPDGRSVQSIGLSPITRTRGKWVLASGTDSTLWVVEDAGNYRIQQYAPSGEVLRTLVRRSPAAWYVFAYRNRESLDSALSVAPSLDITAERLSRPKSWFPPSLMGGLFDDGTNLWVAFNVAVDGWESIRPEYGIEGMPTDETLSQLYRTVIEVIDRTDGTLRARAEIPGIGQLLNSGHVVVASYTPTGIIELNVYRPDAAPSR